MSQAEAAPYIQPPTLETKVAVQITAKASDETVPRMTLS